MAQTMVNYNAGDKDMVSFRGNTPCRVMSKSAGENADVWEIEVQGRRGYAPRTMIQEQKIMIKSADLIQVFTSGENGPNISKESNVLKTNEDSDNINKKPVTEPVAKKVNMYKTGESLGENSETLRKEIFGVNIDKSKNPINQEMPQIEDTSKKPEIILQNTENTGENLSDELIQNSEQNNEVVKAAEINEIELSANENTDKFSTKNEPNKTSLNPDGKTSEEFKANETYLTETYDSVVSTETDTLISINNSKATNNKIENLHKIDSDQNENEIKDFDSSSNSNDANIGPSRESLQIDDRKNEKYNTSQTFDFSETINSEKQKVNVLKNDDVVVENQAGKILNVGDDNDPKIVKNEIYDEERKTTSASNQHSADENQQFSVSYQNNEMQEIHQLTKDIPLPIQSLRQESAKKQEPPSIQETNTDNLFSTYIENEPKTVVEEQNYENGWITETIDTLSNVLNSMSSSVQSFLRDTYEMYIGAPKLDSNKNINSYRKDICPKIEIFYQTEKYSTIRNTKYGTIMDEIAFHLISKAEIVVLLFLVAFTTLIFIFGHYCLVNHRKESVLIEKLNTLERKLFVSEKECSIAKTQRDEIKTKLTGIANKSFGADDMIKQYEKEKTELQEQIIALEKELETAAEAGLELNKMLSELLNNQSGSDSIINSVEELQQQLNEQEATTISINNLLAEKSRENSELNVKLSEIENKFGEEIDELLKQNNQLKEENEKIETKMKESIHDLKTQYQQDVEKKNLEIRQCYDNNKSLKLKYNEVLSKWHLSAAQAESLRETLEKLEKLSADEIFRISEITDANTKYLAVNKECTSLKELLNAEIEMKIRLEEQIADINNESARLRSEANQNEKEKLEAQTRLDVLSSYFKEKESQLQK